MKELSKHEKCVIDLPESRFEKFIDDVKEQYQNQKEILEKTGILEKFSNGEPGIKGIDGKEYVFPTLDEVLKRTETKQEILKEKSKHGFTQLLIVPFGMRLDDLAGKLGDVLLKHYNEGKIFATKKDPAEPDKPVKLDKSNPVWNRYKPDEIEKMVYFQKEFSPNHEGKTKKEILGEKNQGFKIFLIEDLPNIPWQGRGKIIGGRKQLESNSTSGEYLKTLQSDKAYFGEKGIIPEAEITYAILHLKKTGQIIDDVGFLGNGRASYQIGAFLPERAVPLFRWQDEQYVLGRCVADMQRYDRGTRTLVEI